MKYALFFVLAVSLVAACSEGKTRTEELKDNNTSIKTSDDGSTLTIKVKRKNTIPPVNYSASFDVRAMSADEKKNLKNHILDSLGIKK
jgi:hypothetical protein